MLGADINMGGGVPLKFGKFATDRLLLGSGVTPLVAISNSNNYNLSLMVTPFAKYYFAPKGGFTPEKKLYFFVDGGLGYRIGVAGNGTDNYTAHSFRAQAGFGAAYFITPNVSVEGRYGGVLGLGDISNGSGYQSNTYFTSSPSVGLQLYLRGKKHRNKAAE